MVDGNPDSNTSSGGRWKALPDRPAFRVAVRAEKCRRFNRICGIRQPLCCLRVRGAPEGGGGLMSAGISTVK